MRPFWLVKSVLMTFAVLQPTAFGQLLTDLPEKVQAIGVDEKLGEVLPTNLQFRDERGMDVTLGKFVNGSRPVIVTLNYSNCPGLCVAQLDGLTRGLGDLVSLEVGKDFDIVTVSIDPRETPQKATETKAKYLGMLNRSNAASGWHFLTGDKQSIVDLAEAVGFRYNYDAKFDRYNHVSVAVIVSPKGKITRYLYTVDFPPETIKIAVIEASEGKIGTPFDAFLMMCYQYDPNANRYSADARRVMAFGGAACVLVLLGITVPFWFAGRRSTGGAVAATETAVPVEQNSGDQPH